jgi:hypothetical protein
MDFFLGCSSERKECNENNGKKRTDHFMWIGFGGKDRGVNPSKKPLGVLHLAQNWRLKGTSKNLPLNKH